MSNSKQDTIALLKISYSMELETVMNYLAHSINLDGVRAEEIKKALGADITEELTHAQEVGKRIKQLGGTLPGSAGLTLGGQRQPTADTTDVISVIEAVIDAEQHACTHYQKIIKSVEGTDYVTQDLCIRLLADEEEHLTLFRGFLKEYRQGRP